MQSFRSRLLTTSIFVAFGFMAEAGMAQSLPSQPPADDAHASDIVVTGTRIARPDLEVASPVSVIGSAEIDLRHPATAQELLQDLPSARPNLGPAVNNGGDGSASIDLRGIGTNRTLVLLDSHRIVPFGLDGVTDLNVVPIALVGRVDVVTGGASSTYGADAVAGVVNFVTKKNFSGVDMSAGYRISEKGDARQYQGNVVLGANFDDKRGNAVLSIGYSKRDPLMLTDRSYSYSPISSATGQFSASTVALQSIFTTPSNAALGLPASNFGAVVDQATGTLRAATAADTYNSNENSYFLTPLKRINIYSSAHYELTPGVELYATGFFNRNKARIQQASTGTFANVYNLPLSNAYLPAGVRTQLCNSIGLSTAACAAAAAATTPTSAGYREIPVVAQRRFVEFGPRGNQINSDVYQVQLGVRGDILPKLHYDLSAQYGQTIQNQLRENWGSSSKLQQALRSYRNASGSAVCSDTSNGCVPLNLFGPIGSITSDQLAFIDLDAMINRKVSQSVVTGSIDGDLFGLASPFADAPFAFSVGGEYRKLSAASQPDAASQIQGEVLGTGARTPADHGAYDVKEAFGELIAPLITEKPFIYRFQIEAGIRYSDYSTTGGSTTWKAGATYEPVRGVKLRGMYQVAVRSPNIQELYQSPVTALGNLAVDPCQASQLRSSAANPGLAALCVATGAPAATIGNIPAPTASQINNATSGNANLGPEKAKTYTLGAVLTPISVPGLSLTVDYFNITVKDAITKPASGDILNGCYSAALNPSFTYNAFCALIKRNPLNGGLSGGPETPGVILSGSNLGRIETAGFDVALNYGFDLSMLGLKGDPGRLSLSLSGTYLDYYHFQATPNAINRDCTGHYSNDCATPRPKVKINGRFTYTKGPISGSLLWNHISPVNIEPFSATATQPLSTPQTAGPNPTSVLAAYRHVSAYDYFDFGLKAKITEDAELTLTVENMFDKKPPFVGNTVAGSAFNAGNTFPTLYDVVGRAYSVGARFKF